MGTDGIVLVEMWFSRRTSGFGSLAAWFRIKTSGVMTNEDSETCSLTLVSGSLSSMVGLGEGNQFDICKW